MGWGIGANAIMAAINAGQEIQVRLDHSLGFKVQGVGLGVGGWGLTIDAGETKLDQLSSKVLGLESRACLGPRRF